LGFYNDGIIESITTNMMYFTIWGKYMTLIMIISSIYVDDELELVEKLNFIDDSYL
jgi:hypothetical protein